jgi:hypothetical protein
MPGIGLGQRDTSPQPQHSRGFPMRARERQVQRDALRWPISPAGGPMRWQVCASAATVALSASTPAAIASRLTTTLAPMARVHQCLRGDHQRQGYQPEERGITHWPTMGSRPNRPDSPLQSFMGPSYGGWPTRKRKPSAYPDQFPPYRWPGSGERSTASPRDREFAAGLSFALVGVDGPHRSINGAVSSSLRPGRSARRVAADIPVDS